MYCGSCERYTSRILRECKECKIKINANYKGITKYKEYIHIDSINKRIGSKIKEECPKCKSEYMYYYTMQLRSADEGQTVFYECECGYKEKLNT
ncbi:DNA-directed RNA polymerase I subunit RPA12 [Nematocida sp. AWRm80]|nr:DNA-directed RNA polymerase I subunit RPA12 [Nematocida sp. AWRm80]